MFNNERGIVALLVLVVCYGVVGHNDYQETVLQASEQSSQALVLRCVPVPMSPEQRSREPVTPRIITASLRGERDGTPGAVFQCVVVQD